MPAPHPVPLRLTRAVAAAVALLCPALLLRADSDGPAPGLGAVLVVGVVLTAAAWPLTSRALGAVRAPAGALLAQLLLHGGLLWAATGSPVHAGALGSVCSPAAPALTSLSGCGIGAVTAVGGLPLLLAQLVGAGLVGLLLACTDAALVRALVELPRLAATALISPVRTTLLAHVVVPVTRAAPPSALPVEQLPRLTAAVRPLVRRGPPLRVVPAACA